MSDLHIYPLEDLRDHVLKRDCWCHPTQDEENPEIWVHHSMDGRELVEQGERMIQ